MGHGVLSFLLLTALAGRVSAQGANPFTGNAKETDAGRGLFRIRCAPCHGIKAQGGRGPDLTLGTFSNGDQDADLFRVISTGVPGTEMPPYGELVGRENVWRLVSYIRSAAAGQPAPLKGDSKAGETLYWGKGACGQCHRAGDRGGRMGPDLSRVGRTRSVRYLRESIVAPNADLTPGFYKITATLAGGKEIVGTQRGFTNFSCQLMDAGERIYSFDRTEVSCEREFVSLMPSYEKTLTEAEIDHLVAYLVSLRGETR
jgi:cytochrome c oxidase cbb3-type subunit III